MKPFNVKDATDGKPIVDKNGDREMITAEEARNLSKNRDITYSLDYIDSLIRQAVEKNEIQVMWRFHGAVRDILGIGFRLPPNISNIRDYLEKKGFDVAVRETTSDDHYLVISW